MVNTARVTGGSNRSGVAIRPFRAWRLVPDRLPSLADRNATPWNQNDGHGRADPTRPGRILSEWQEKRVLVREQQPALYAYEQTGPRGSQRGVISAVHLDSRLLPHEDIMPRRVEDMVEIMQAGTMNLSPILLGYSGDGRTSSHVAEAARHTPLTEVFTTDGQEHRLWRLTDTEARRDITAELRTRAAFIADGHHRHVAARQLRRQLYADGYGPGPWDYMSGLLVDVKYTPLRLNAIHRVLPHLDPQRALAAASARFRIVELSGPLDEWLDVLRAHAYRNPAFVIATRDGAYLLTDPHPRFLDEVLRRRPEPIGKMNISVLQSLIDTAWEIPDSPQEIRYDASPTNAVRLVHESGGIAALLTPPHQRDLFAAAAAGVRLPYKTTSFGPKPHPGLAVRTLDTSRR